VGGQFTVTVVGLPEGTVEASSREEAIDRAREAVGRFVSKGEFVKIEIEASTRRECSHHPRCSPARIPAMLVERTLYFSKPGHAADVLDVRRRASRVRTDLGLPAGTIFVARGESDAPDVSWECRFSSEEAHRRDLDARDRSEAFSRIREEMQGHRARFERHFFARDGRGDVDLEGVSLAPEEHTFATSDAELKGFLYLPPGVGPFPAMILNHGSTVDHESTDLSKPAVASVLVSWGLACFFPNRWGYGRSPGRYWKEDVTAEFGTAEYDSQLVRRLHREANDVIAALDYVASLDAVDADHVGVMGSSFGGTVSLVAAAKCDRFRCGIDFAGAAMNWERTPRLRELMKQAVRALEIPIFLLQAANDYSTGPTEELGAVLEREGKTYAAKVFPPFGVTKDEGHLFERAGSVVWGPEVRQFLERYL